MFRTISTLCLTMLCGVVSMAQTQQLTLEKCRELALQNNKQILIGAEKVRAAGYQKKEAFAAYLGIDFAFYDYTVHKMEVYANEGNEEAPRFVPLEELGENIG